MTVMKRTAAAFALTLLATPAFASTPQTVFIPSGAGQWSGTWKKVSWYPQIYINKPGEGTYIRGTRRGGNIATVETLRRSEHFKYKGNFQYSVFIRKYDCANDTNDSIIEAVAPLQAYNARGNYWKDRLNYSAKVITIDGIAHWWNPRPYWDSEEFRMRPPKMGTYGAAVQDAVCKNVRQIPMKLQKGDVVRLAASVTQAEFGLALCDDDGEMLEIDGKVWNVGSHGVYVSIKRMHPRPAPWAWEEGAVARWVRPEEVLEVLEGEPRLWPNAARLKEVSDERDGKVQRKPEPVFWTVGVDEIPRAQSFWGMKPVQKIPQLGEVIPSWNGDGEEVQEG